jgi:hypothetical protein
MDRVGTWLMLGGLLVGLGSCFGYGQLGGFSDNDHGNPDLKSAFAGFFMLSVPVVAAGFIFLMVGAIRDQFRKPNPKL